MFPFKIILLVGIMWGKAIRVVSCDKNNLPRGHSPLKDGINIYPPRPHRPTKNISNISSFSLAPEHLCPYTTTDAKELISSIDKIVNSFYSNNYHQINMRGDGGVGLGVLKGQLNYLLGKREDKFSPRLKELLEQLHATSGKLAVQILDQSIAASADASIKFGIQVIRNNTNVLQARFRDWKGLDKIAQHFSEFKNVGEENDLRDPYKDFQCIVAMVKDCTIPHDCQKVYLTGIHSQSMLMHQVMYQQFAERRSCITVNQEAFGNAQEYRDRLCSKAYLEAQFLEKHGFPTRYVDLFAEQVGFCGLLGYPNFMKAEWLREILSWQMPPRSGCITNFYGENKMGDVLVFADGKDGTMEEEPCLVHLSSVTLMAMSLNLRYMMDVCPVNIFGEVFL